MSFMQSLSQSVTDSWYQKGLSWTRVLLPLSWLFNVLAARRKKRYLQKKRWQPPVPVMVVGNISIGGTGKTPVVGTLVKALQHRGYKPGIISRGFGSANASYPISVTPESDPSLVGDEPVMLSRQLQVPLVVDPDRVEAAKYLLDQYDCDLLIADDGLQHYNLQRDIEILVVDGERMLGNGLCLPAGPLREPPERMNSVDLVLINGDPKKGFPISVQSVKARSFYLQPDQLLPVSAQRSGLAPENTKVHAVAGIGNPNRFFTTLSELGYQVIPHAYPDHHAYEIADVEFNDSLPVLMTAKDAVKCQPFADQRHWYLPITTSLSEEVLDRIETLIKTRIEPKP